MNRIASDAEFYARLGAQVRAERKRLGLTQAQLAAKCGIGRSHVGFIEQGRQNATLKTLRKLGRVFGKPVSDFLPE